MNHSIELVQIVSDGIVVRFSDGLITYYPETFLREYAGVGSNQVFLDYDPTEVEPEAQRGAGLEYAPSEALAEQVGVVMRGRSN